MKKIFMYFVLAICICLSGCGKSSLAHQVRMAKCVFQSDREKKLEELDSVKFGKVKRTVKRPTKNEWGEEVGEYEYEEKDLEWVVLEKNDDKALLLCKDDFGSVKYFGREEDHCSNYNFYEYGSSQIKMSLDKIAKNDISMFNNENNFYYFNDEEKQMMIEVEIENRAHVSKNKLFILNQNEFDKYFPNKKTNGKNPNASSDIKWWVRCDNYFDSQYIKKYYGGIDYGILGNAEVEVANLTSGCGVCVDNNGKIYNKIPIFDVSVSLYMRGTNIYGQKFNEFFKNDYAKPYDELSEYAGAPVISTENQHYYIRPAVWVKLK